MTRRRSMAGSESARSGGTDDSIAAWLRRRPVIAVLLATSLPALLAHAWAYRFLTDDAFIAFRYARNLADGHGLVFNPGFERVEGYSNFLLVIVLAIARRLGFSIETAAQALSLAATVGLWWIVVRETLRQRPSSGPAWLVLIPAFGLAITRSVAVWSTSGLETRLFELLLVAGVFRWIAEVEALGSERRFRPWGAVLLALAAWTRPDGLLLAGGALGAGLAFAIGRGGFRARTLALLVAPFVVLVAAHQAFRLAYYGDWLPNTYYVKIGGRTWWAAGLRYLAAFALEYAVYLWIPLIVAGVFRLRAEGKALFPLIVGAMLVPQLIYVAAIGGDHFEYRPLDIVFPFAFLLLYHGARSWARRPRAEPAIAVAFVVIGIGLWEIAFRSRAAFPAEYVAGFPGGETDPRIRGRYLDPDRDPIYRWPGLRSIAAAHRRLLEWTTLHFVGVRQEEHVRFLASVRPVGVALRGLIADGRLPRDVYLAMLCVGVIPYDSNVRTLDRIGLTDAHVAHSPFFRKKELAHDKSATEEYACSRGVDLWLEVRGVCRVNSGDLAAALRHSLEGQRVYLAAALGDRRYLIGRAPCGREWLARRIPHLRFEPMNDPAFLEAYMREGVAAYREHLRASPDDNQARSDLALLYGEHGDFTSALELFREAAAREPDDPDLWLRVGWCEANLGHGAEAIAAFQHCIDVARAQNLNETAAKGESMLESVRRSGLVAGERRTPLPTVDR